MDKSKPIQITNKSERTQYSLKENLFDPFKCSPPNNFIIKLKTRLSSYNKDFNSKTK
jgi:hypothetical protein